MINRFSIEDLFRVIISKRNIVFQLEKFNSVHFTIAYNENSPDINLHISKEVENGRRKPRITVAVWNKKNLELASDRLTQSMISSMIEDFDESYFQANQSDYYMIPYSRFSKSSDLENLLLKHFQSNITKPRKTKVKLIGDLEESLKNYSKDKSLFDLYNEWIEPFTDPPKDNIQAYMILSENEFLNLLNFRGKWYKFKENLGNANPLEDILGNKLAKRLYWKFWKSLIIVMRANSWEETEPFNHGIRIQYKPPCTNNGQLK